MSKFAARVKLSAASIQWRLSIYPYQSVSVNPGRCAKTLSGEAPGVAHRARSKFPSFGIILKPAPIEGDAGRGRPAVFANPMPKTKDKKPNGNGVKMGIIAFRELRRYRTVASSLR